VTDFVSVKDLSVRAVIGVHAWERDVEQTLMVSVDMATDVRKAAASDDLADALDYSAVAETIAAVLRDGRFRLIETAAEHVAGRLLGRLPAELAPPRAQQTHRHGRLHRNDHPGTYPRSALITRNGRRPSACLFVWFE